jgi:hypothetical protein
MSFALRPVKTRKRKGSLRKAALMGGRRIMSAEGRERKNSVSAKSPLGKLPRQENGVEHQPGIIGQEATMGGQMHGLNEPDAVSASSAGRDLGHEPSVAPSGTATGWSEPAAVTAARLSLVTEHKAQLSSSAQDLSSPVDIKSPISNTSYASTTDDDDILTFDRPAKAYTNDTSLPLPKPLSSTATSYFPSPSEISLPRHRATSSNHQKRSPLSHTISSSSLYSHPAPPTAGGHDYTETEYWGWIILFVTWLTFTVGMGSCLEIWSWAWDVGETPYAPPELEDDPTLPIVGYYPALIVLTGVVAWVWITVAWVGMKYFRHAKIEV